MPFTYGKFVTEGVAVEIHGGIDGLRGEIIVLYYPSMVLGLLSAKSQGPKGFQISGTGRTSQDLAQDMERGANRLLSRVLEKLSGHGKEKHTLEQLFPSPEWTRSNENFDALIERQIAVAKRNAAQFVHSQALGGRICECPLEPANQPAPAEKT